MVAINFITKKENITEAHIIIDIENGGIFNENTKYFKMIHNIVYNITDMLNHE